MPCARHSSSISRMMRAAPSSPKEGGSISVTARYAGSPPLEAMSFEFILTSSRPAPLSAPTMGSEANTIYFPSGHLMTAASSPTPGPISTSGRGAPLYDNTLRLSASGESFPEGSFVSGLSVIYLTSGQQPYYDFCQVSVRRAFDSKNRSPVSIAGSCHVNSVYRIIITLCSGKKYSRSSFAGRGQALCLFQRSA